MVKLIDIHGQKVPFRVTFLALSKWEQQHDNGYLTLLQRSRIIELISLFVLGFEYGAKADGKQAPTEDQVISWLDEIPGLASTLEKAAVEQILETTTTPADKKKQKAAQK